ncbi:MAG: DUF5106 domain-containing protein [Muribaculaceae bacterium]|nr:DUF5106 domain-containing protein [Muribaculaceae bacterium]
MMMRNLGFIIITSIILLVIVAGCKGGVSSKHTNVITDTVSTKLHLPFPEIPVTLTDTQDRTTYLLTHFWEGLDVERREEWRDTAFMEQSFSNFVAVMQYGSEEAAQQSVRNLINRVATNDSALKLVEYIAWKYLDEPNSPMRNEDLYIIFLKEYIDNDALPADLKSKAGDRLNIAMMNRPGTRAADFRMTTRNGISTSLSTIVGADTTLVIFYDPECEHCKEITGRIADMSADIPYRILAVNVEDNCAAWNDTKWSYPESWNVAMADTPLQDSELYHFPALPSLYLLAPGGEVILKDFPFMAQ